MKYFIAIALIAAVASAAVKPTPVSAEIAEIQEIVAAIQSPSTDPATAIALEQMLVDVLGVHHDIAVGPAIIPFPLPDGGAIAEEPAVIPAPVVVAPVVVAPNPAPAVVTPAASTPLVQIVLNINQAGTESSPVSVGPAVAPELFEIMPEPVHVVESAHEPVQVVEASPEPVQVVEVAPKPVQVVEVAPVPVEPVQIGVPVFPETAVVLPEELN